MDNLPPEIICYIGDYLGAEKITFSLASKTLNQVLKHDVEKFKENLRKLIEELSDSLTFPLRNGKEATVTLRCKFLLTLKFRELHLPDEQYILRHMKNFFKVKPVMRITYDDISYQFTYKTKKIEVFERLLYVIRKSTFEERVRAESILEEIEEAYRKPNLKEFENLLINIFTYIFLDLRREKKNKNV